MTKYEIQIFNRQGQLLLIHQMAYEGDAWHTFADERMAYPSDFDVRFVKIEEGVAHAHSAHSDRPPVPPVPSPYYSVEELKEERQRLHKVRQEMKDKGGHAVDSYYYIDLHLFVIEEALRVQDLEDKIEEMKYELMGENA